MTEQEEVERGEFLVRVFKLKRIPETDRYQLGEGYGTKTALGVFRTFKSIVEGDALKSHKEDAIKRERGEIT